MSTDPAPKGPSPFDAMLCFDVYAVNLAFGRIYKPLLDPLGLTYPQFLVMMALWARNAQSVGCIGETLGLDSSTLTPLIKRLEAAHMVTRQRDTQDERRVIVSLTEHGSGLRSRSGHVLDCMTEATSLDSKEIGVLQGKLRALRASLQHHAAG